MKKLISLIVLTMMMFSTAYAVDIDWDNLSNEEVRAIIGAGRNEMAKRELIAAEKTVLFEQDGVTVYLTGESKLSYGDFYIGVVIVNNSDKTISIAFQDSYVNGWGLDGYGIYDTAPNKKQKGKIQIFRLEDAEVTEFEDIEEVELMVRVIDANFHTIFTPEPIVIMYNNK